MKYQFKFDQKEMIQLNQGELQASDKIPVSDHLIHILKNQKSHRVQLVSMDSSQGVVQLKIDGQIYQVQVLNETDQMVESLGMSIETGPKAGDILAPMPGKVLQVLVQSGQEVEEGTPLLVLEAMKMENILKSQASGIVQEVNVSKNETVDKNQKLIIIE